MAQHFSAEELAGRRQRTCDGLRARGLAGLLMFRQESMYYLSGYDTFGYVFFQCLLLNADGRMTLLTRAPDLRQARHTSVIEDIRIWVDRAGHNPAEDLAAIVREHDLSDTRLGIELDAYGLTAFNGDRVRAALAPVAALEDASEIVSELRVVKSPREIDHVRRAGALADAALDQAIAHAAPGADEGEILAAMQGAVFAGGGDYPGNPFIIGSGRDALLCRYYTGRRRLAARDQLTLEFAGVYRHYHACLMRTIVIGEAEPRQVAMHRACRDALDAAKAALKPGEAIGGVFDAHARAIDEAGFGPHRLNACGYSLGSTFAPVWMDVPMFYAGNPVKAAPGMVFFLHMILMDSDSERAMTLGETVLVGEDGLERLSRASLDLIVKAA